MKVTDVSLIMAVAAICFAATGCASSSDAHASHADHIKDMVMTRYDGFAEDGGEVCDK